MTFSQTTEAEHKIATTTITIYRYYLFSNKQPALGQGFFSYLSEIYSYPGQ
jgi:hypothetical protein